MSAAKAELGRYLFYDKRISGNGKQSCASCHRQELAFTDGRARALGSTGELHPRGAMSLVNIAYSSALTWKDPHLTSLEEQALTPMFGRNPVELGLPQGAAAFLNALRADPTYQTQFAAAFPGESGPFTLANVTKAIACFERTIISARSPYDRYHFGGDDSAVTESAKRGEILFFSDTLACFHCHGGFNFSDATAYETAAGVRRAGIEAFHDNGLGRGKFKTPSLRNIALTAPYMHDGSFDTLDAVLEHYSQGGMHAPEQDPLVSGFGLTYEQRNDLIAFLESLTDSELIHDPKFSDPWR
jgi:cytochrome c peroxidase